MSIISGKEGKREDTATPCVITDFGESPGPLRGVYGAAAISFLRPVSHSQISGRTQEKTTPGLEARGASGLNLLWLLPHCGHLIKVPRHLISVQVHVRLDLQ